MQNEIQKLLQKDMDRKNFLKHVGIGFAAMAGITTALKTISMLSGSQKDDATSYGSNAYGGRAEVANAVKATNRKIQG
jgi:hypothetical protein